MPTRAHDAIDDALFSGVARHSLAETEPDFAGAADNQQSSDLSNEEATLTFRAERPAGAGSHWFWSSYWRALSVGGHSRRCGSSGFSAC